jgi:hypothetical protein
MIQFSTSFKACQRCLLAGIHALALSKDGFLFAKEQGMVWYAWSAASSNLLRYTAIMRVCMYITRDQNPVNSITQPRASNHPSQQEQTPLAILASSHQLRPWYLRSFFFLFARSPAALISGRRIECFCWMCSIRYLISGFSCLLFSRCYFACLCSSFRSRSLSVLFLCFGSFSVVPR